MQVAALASGRGIHFAAHRLGRRLFLSGASSGCWPVATVIDAGRHSGSADGVYKGDRHSIVADVDEELVWRSVESCLVEDFVKFLPQSFGFRQALVVYNRATDVPDRVMFLLFDPRGAESSPP